MGNGTKAAMKNYNVDSERVAAAIASENLTKPMIVNAIQDALPDELLAQVHLEGLQATKRSGTGGMKIGIGTDGQVNDFGHTEIDEPDYAVRHKYLDSAYKIKGSYAAEKHINVNLEVKPSDKVKELADGLLENQRQGDSRSS